VQCVIAVITQQAQTLGDQGFVLNARSFLTVQASDSLGARLPIHRLLVLLLRIQGLPREVWPLPERAHGEGRCELRQVHRQRLQCASPAGSVRLVDCRCPLQPNSVAGGSGSGRSSSAVLCRPPRDASKAPRPPC
jgi:hypothetical protein